MTYLGETKPSLKTLAHFGVLGMKWGHRQTANTDQIRAARKNLKSEAKDYRKESKKLNKTAEGSDKRIALEKKLSEMHKEYLKNPDRVIAARMTRGEKATALLVSLESGPGAIANIGSIAGSSLVSRRIEYKQDKGAYNNFKDKKVQKRIGFQKGRTALMLGAAIGPSLMNQIGPIASQSIAAKAAANRKAAQYAARAPKGLSNVAAKVAYASKRRGAFKITTL